MWKRFTAIGNDTTCYSSEPTTNNEIVRMLSQHWQLMKNESGIGAKNCLFPQPTTLVRTLINGKPNYIAITHVGLIDPASVSLGMNKNHYNNGGIKMNHTLSVNFPSVKLLVKETDCLGLVSEKNRE